MIQTTVYIILSRHCEHLLVVVADGRAADRPMCTVIGTIVIVLLIILLNIIFNTT